MLSPPPESLHHSRGACLHLLDALHPLAPGRERCRGSGSCSQSRWGRQRGSAFSPNTGRSGTDVGSPSGDRPSGASEPVPGGACPYQRQAMASGRQDTVLLSTGRGADSHNIPVCSVGAFSAPGILTHGYVLLVRTPTAGSSVQVGGSIESGVGVPDLGASVQAGWESWPCRQPPQQAGDSTAGRSFRPACRVENGTYRLS